MVCRKLVLKEECPKRVRSCHLWENDSMMTSKPPKDSPPASPTTPLLSGDAGKSLNVFTGLKFGYPFKGSLKRVQQRPYVPPSLECDDIVGVVQPDKNLTKKRSIKWVDNYGEDLIQVKEFEASECEGEDSDDEEHLFASCNCAIQ